MCSTLIFSHRGHYPLENCPYFFDAKENRLLSFQTAMTASPTPDGIELDVHLSADGELMVIHDETTLRTTGKKGVVQDMTWQELADLGIARLEEVFQCAIANHYKGFINIEIKNNINPYPGIEEKVIALCRTFTNTHPELAAQLILSSFNHQAIQIVKQEAPEFRISLLAEDFSDIETELIEELKPFSISINGHNFSIIQIWHILSTLNPLHIKLFCYTINDPERLQILMKSGVHGIFSDNPQLAFRVLSGEYKQNQFDDNF